MKTSALFPSGFLALWFGFSSQAQLVIESTFDTGPDGWTQVNVASDFRYLTDINFDEACVDPPSNGFGRGHLGFCDPDAGSWMFSAPPKFLGDQAAKLDGVLRFSLGWVAVEPLVDYPQNLDPNVVVANRDTAIVFQQPLDPEPGAWRTFDLALNESAGWRWVDDSTPMEDLPLASRAQIAQVLANVTALRILGEFVTGADWGFLDQVRLEGPPVGPTPRLTIRAISSARCELSWPAPGEGWTLESSGHLGALAEWVPVPDVSGAVVLVPIPEGTRFYRLRRP